MPNKIGKTAKISETSFILEKRTFIAFALIVLGILGRTLFHLGDNVEFVTSASLLSASFLGFGWAIMVPLTIMVVSDLIIGNSIIYIFTWSAYLLIGIIGYFFLRTGKNTPNKIVRATLMGVNSSIIFYVWTNFGVWFLDSFSMYSDSLSGLIDSYIMGIPFFKSNLVGNLILVPSSFLILSLITAKGFKIFQTKKIYSLS